MSLFGAGCSRAPAELPSPASVDAMTPEEKSKAMEEYEKTVPSPSDPAPAEPMPTTVASKSGAFHERVHRATGTAKLVNDNGTWKVVLSDDFTTDAGPDLHVYVSGNPDPKTSPEVHQEPSADLGSLKGTSGAQTYELGNIDPSNVKSIVIYCKPFKVVFSVATLQ